MISLYAKRMLEWFYKLTLDVEKELTTTNKEECSLRKGETIHHIAHHTDNSKTKKILSVSVEPDFDIETFKAALNYAKTGDFEKPMKSQSINEVLNHLIERTNKDEEIK